MLLSFGNLSVSDLANSFNRAQRMGLVALAVTQHTTRQRVLGAR
jgi:hypothetical protein